MNVTLRRATPEDIPQIAAIEAASFPVPWQEQIFFIFMHDKTRFTVLEKDGKIVGYAILEIAGDEVSELDNIAVSPESRKKGYARILMDDIVATSRALNKKRIWLEVRESNTPAISLYESYGFKTDGVRTNYYRNPTENGLLMSLKL